ncbi:MAG: histidine kinase dimerization/phospho-acceptor domain-containing protein [Gemmatimonadota bacterium]
MTTSGPSIAQSVAELAEREPQHRRAFESSSAPQLLVHLATGAIADVNLAATRFYGWPRESMTAMYLADLGTPAGWSTPLRTTHRTASGLSHEVELHSASLDVQDTAFMHVIVHALVSAAGASAPASGASSTPFSAPSSGASGELSSIVRRVGHDLNNVLTVIRGAAVFLQDVVPPGSQASEDLASIERAADRAEALTEELQRGARDAK